MRKYFLFFFIFFFITSVKAFDDRERKKELADYAKRLFAQIMISQLITSIQKEYLTKREQGDDSFFKTVSNELAHNEAIRTLVEKNKNIAKDLARVYNYFLTNPDIFFSLGIPDEEEKYRQLIDTWNEFRFSNPLPKNDISHKETPLLQKNQLKNDQFDDIKKNIFSLYTHWINKPYALYTIITVAVGGILFLWHYYSQKNEEGLSSFYF